MNFDIEKEYILNGVFPVAGIDEAGRGPLAGPVCAASVILNPENIPEGINDSKKLSQKKREMLFDKIMESSSVSYAFVDEKTIDEINILQATKLAMRRSVQGLCEKPKMLLIDGNFIIGEIENEKCIVSGDALCVSIAAASVIAKVARDRFMEKIDEEYPMYGFKKHKGYGTKEHIEKLLAFGPCPYHRRSFLKNILK